MYQQIKNSTSVLRIADGAYIPSDNGNSDWKAYLAWKNAGNSPTAEPSQPIASRRFAVWEQIKAKREHLKASGVLVGSHWYHSDADSRIQQIGLVMMGANLPSGLKWKVKDNGLVDMTPTLAQQIFQATATWDMQVFGVAETHRAAVMASDDPEHYDWSAGWPAGYSGQE